MASATVLAIPNSLIILEMTKPPPWTWKVVVLLPWSRCTVADTAAADQLDFHGFLGPLPVSGDLVAGA